MLKKITVSVEVVCPVCNKEFQHSEDLEIICTLKEFNEGKYSTIGSSKQIIGSTIHVPCAHCKVWHAIDVEPIEVHVFPSVEIDRKYISYYNN